MSPDAPPLLFRISVVAGGAALVLGLVGAALIMLRGDGDESVRGPGLFPRVRLVGRPADLPVAVEAAWTEADQEYVAAGIPLPGSPDVWVLVPPIPDSRTVRVTVKDVSADPAIRLLERLLDLAPGREEVLVLSSAASGAPEGDDGPPR